ncbi:GntR family transcriptional regulator [Streptomyces sparsogenes]|uniref:GntR family transcriptional regulator n=1 Tax=Streptomyces sparsogenes DSM 40356 TaxID=1331668 RepID=A0A1R1S809_9ACTN|nr:GntR family transcriptional regulator [Streptomyces sparsogenes]OMI34420.1 hypothetical protein SPAR_36591 [Streptomyces sparsogenes DSM 40356]
MSPAQSSTSPPERTALYRYFDTDGGLLYIGISRDPDGRLKAHRDTHQKWVPMVKSRTLEWFDSRPEAAEAEKQAIQVERPRFNKAHNQDRVAFAPSRWPSLAEQDNKSNRLAALIRDEIETKRWLPGQLIPFLNTLAKASGTSKSIAAKAVGQLRHEGLLTFRAGHGLFVAHPHSRRNSLIVPPPQEGSTVRPRTPRPAVRTMWLHDPLMSVC